MARVSSWFGLAEGNGNKESVLSKEILRALGPPDRSQVGATSRFSQLLLEHGESILQDWAVTASSSMTTRISSSRSEQCMAPAQDDSTMIQWAQQQQSPASQLSTTSTLPISSTSGQLPLQASSSLIMSGIQGRLHLCSRSLVFEPADAMRAIIRLPFAHMQGQPTILEQATDAIQCTSERHFVIKDNNVIAPFVLVKQPGAFKFGFRHSSPTLCRRLIEQRVLAAQQTDKSPEAVTKVEEAIFFSENLVDMRESIVLTNVRASMKTPLLSQAVVLALTTERLYLQPHQEPSCLTDNAIKARAGLPSPALNWVLRDIIATARRYNGLRDSGLQIYFRSGSSILIALERRHEREQVLRALPDVVCFTDRTFVEHAVKEWQGGTISNYQYLLALNSAAGRTFHDLGRYPVFPWVIQDYDCTHAKLDLKNPACFRDLSKPVGALNPERLKYFKSRMKGMHDMGTEFLYGTHYSAPGYVLYYLVRSMPEHMLCLQNGKFDAADRMFFDVEHTFKCALTNHADVKELIPEFYGSDIDFLINARGLHLGATQNGQRVDDVRLPSWAKSAKDFLKQNRMALESETCTNMLPQWIDLIFGYKSRGIAAHEADNLFHPISYFGPTELAAMPSEEERQSAELQAIEFGCCPDQLFVKIHPRKTETTTGSQWDFISSDIGRASSKDDEKGRDTWELLDAPTVDGLLSEEQLSVDALKVEASHVPKGVTSGQDTATAMGLAPLKPNVGLHKKGEPFMSEPHHTPSEQGVTYVPSEAIVNTKPSFDDAQTMAVNTSDWNMQVIERKHVHGDTISGCIMVLDSRGSILVTTSLDGGLKAHKLALTTGVDEAGERKAFPSSFGRFSYSTIMSRSQVSSIPFQSKLREYRSHSSRDPLASLALARDGANGIIAFAGGHDDVVLAYGISSACAVASVYSHRDAVTGLDLITRAPFDSESAIWLENSTHVMISGSWDAAVKVWSICVSKSEAVSISREPLAELFDAESSIVCVSAISMPGYSGGIVIAAGCVDSSLCAWRVHNDGVQVSIHNESARQRGSGPCSVVNWISVDGVLHLLAAFASGKVASYSMVGEGLKRDSAISIGVAVLSLAYCAEQQMLLLGCADGGLRLIALRDGAHFDTKPILWADVNNKSSPGIASIHSVDVGTPERRRCLCATGGTDGSVALFEICKRNT